ncbi:MAG: hypothetical protein COA42_23490 [Alteromonadaceae bacterium]|nr:MAG: hypothetical protein COA42_23490 [Alteromonadaceae bacterium]
MSGLFLISLSSFISNLLGTLNSLPDLLYVFIGANLIVFSASLFVLATLVQKTPAIWTKIVVALDVGWVLGSVVLLALYSTYLSLFGVVIIAVVASIVGALAFWQWHSLMSVSVNSRQLA